MGMGMGAWGHEGMGDAEYLAAFDRLIDRCLA